MFTNNPEYDAERNENERDKLEQEQEAMIARAVRFFEQALACEAKAWFTDPVRPYENRSSYITPDDLLSECLWHETDEKYKKARYLFAKLMTSEYATELRQEAARILADQFPDAGDLND